MPWSLWFSAWTNLFHTCNRLCGGSADYVFMSTVACISRHFTFALPCLRRGAVILTSKHNRELLFPWIEQDAEILMFHKVAGHRIYADSKSESEGRSPEIGADREENFLRCTIWDRVYNIQRNFGTGGKHGYLVLCKKVQPRYLADNGRLNMRRNLRSSNIAVCSNISIKYSINALFLLIPCRGLELREELWQGSNRTWWHVRLYVDDRSLEVLNQLRTFFHVTQPTLVYEPLASNSCIGL